MGSPPRAWTPTDGARWEVATDAEAALLADGAQVVAELVLAENGLIVVGLDGSVLGADSAIWASP